MTDFKKILAPWVGLVAILVFGYFIVYLLRHLAYDELSWSRTVYIFGSVEAVAFTAFGYFFGKEVHRERAENAEKQAQSKTTEARDAAVKEATAKTNLNALVMVIDKKRERKRSTLWADAFMHLIGSEQNIEQDLPGTASYIAGRRKSGHMVPSDPDWEELAGIARELASRE